MELAKRVEKYFRFRISEVRDLVVATLILAFIVSFKDCLL